MNMYICAINLAQEYSKKIWAFGVTFVAREFICPCMYPMYVYNYNNFQ